MTERTLLILKPDAIVRGLMGEIITRIERKGLKIVACRMDTLSKESAAEHYAEHMGKSFYDGLITFMTSGPVLLMAVEGSEAINVTRRIMGATKGTEALPGTIRGDYCQLTNYNLIHGSDSPESAKRELAHFFPL